MNDENKEYEESDSESDFIETEHIIELSEMYPHTKENKRSSLKNGKEDRDFKSLGYQCNQCQYGVDSKILLKVHMTTQHGMKYNPEI